MIAYLQKFSLESYFVFSGGFSFHFSCPFMATDFALFRIGFSLYLLASAFGASFFSSH